MSQRTKKRRKIVMLNYGLNLMMNLKQEIKSVIRFEKLLQIELLVIKFGDWPNDSD